MSIPRLWLLVTALWAVTLAGVPLAGHAAEEAPAEAVSAGEAVENIVVTGSWRGAKLRCRKEEGRAVRCGKPEAFEVTFNEDGTGVSADDRFPTSFTYAWTSPTEVVITPQPEGDELKLFQLELEEGFLTFQAYIYLPVEDASLPAEVNYIHYIFDVMRAD